MKPSQSPLRPRKIPVQPRALETYAAILEAAALILEGHGFEAFNTNTVAERAGVSIGSLYQYFPGKKALVIALMRREKERFKEDARASLAANSARDALAHLAGAALRHKLMRPELARLLDLEETKPEAHQEVGGTSGYRSLVRAALERSRVSPDRIEPAVEDIVALLRLLVEQARARSEPNVGSIEAPIRGAVLGYLDGLESAAPLRQM